MLQALAATLAFLSAAPLGCAPLPLPACASPPGVEAPQPPPSPMPQRAPRLLLRTGGDCAWLVSGVPPPTACGVHAPPLHHPARAAAPAQAATGATSGLDAVGEIVSPEAGFLTLAWVEAAPLALDTATALLQRLAPGALCAAPLTTTSPEMGGDAPSQLWSLSARSVVAAAMHDGYAPWSTPDGAAAAQRMLHALAAAVESEGQGAARGDSPASEDAASPLPPALRAACAAELLAWCDAATSEGAWKQPAAHGVRYAAAWVFTAMTRRELASGAGLAAGLHAAFRLCDDWEATSAWLGLSMFAHALALVQAEEAAAEAAAGEPREVVPAAGEPAAARAPPFAPLLRTQCARLLLPAIDRAADSGHPTVLGLAHAARLAALALLHGPPPALHASRGVRAIQRGASRDASTEVGAGAGAALAAAAAAAAPGDRLFSGPFEDALSAACRALSMASAPDVQYAHLAYGVWPLLAAASAGDGAAGGACAALAGGATVLPPLAALARDAGDARVVAAALHAILALLRGAGASLALPDRHAAALLRRAPGSAGADAGAAPPPSALLLARADVLDEALAAALTARAQAQAGLYACPRLTPLDARGNVLRLPARATRQETEGGSGAAGDALRALLGEHAQALLSQVRRWAPAYVAAVFQELECV